MKTMKNYTAVMLPSKGMEYGAINIDLKNKNIMEIIGINKTYTGVPHHLHCVSDSANILPNDWCLLFDSFGTIFSDAPQQYKPEQGHVLNTSLRKVIATTDKSLGLPLIPEISVRLFIDKPSFSIALEMDDDTESKFFNVADKILELYNGLPDCPLKSYLSKWFTLKEEEIYTEQKVMSILEEYRLVVWADGATKHTLNQFMQTKFK